MTYALAVSSFIMAMGREAAVLSGGGREAMFAVLT